MGSLEGTVVTRTTNTTFAARYTAAGETAAVLILQHDGVAGTLDLHLDITAFPAEVETCIVQGDFNVFLVNAVAEIDGVTSVPLGDRRFIMVDVTSVTAHACLAADGTGNTEVGTLTGDALGELVENSFDDGVNTTIILSSTDDTASMRQFNLYVGQTGLTAPFRPAQNVLDSCEAGTFKILLAGVNLQSRSLPKNVMFSNFNPCRIAPDTTAISTVAFACDQAVVVLADITVAQDGGVAVALEIQNGRTETNLFELLLKDFVATEDDGRPTVRLTVQEASAIKLSSFEPDTFGDYVVLDCNLLLKYPEPQEVAVPFLLESLQMSGSAVVESAYVGTILDVHNVHVSKGSGMWNPEQSTFVFHGTSAAQATGPVNLWATSTDTCVLYGLQVQYDYAASRVRFENVIFVSDVDDGHVTTLMIAIDEADYALALYNRVTPAVDAVAPIPVTFVGNSVVVVRHRDAYGVLLDSEGEKRHMRLEFAEDATLRSYRDGFTVESGVMSNVGVVFRGVSTTTPEPLDIGDFDMAHMDQETPGVEDDYKNTLVFGTAALSVDDDNQSNVVQMVKTMVGQEHKWISSKGHHLTSWKYDDAPVMYRKIDPTTGRKILYSDAECVTRIPMRQDVAYILGLTPETAEFTGANGGFIGVDLELHSNGVIDALKDDAIINTEAAQVLTNALEEELFGDGVSPSHVGIAGSMNSQQGGSDVIRSFNAQPSGDFSIYFEPDEGFLQNDPSGAPKRRYYYLGNTVVKARFYDDQSDVSILKSNYASAWALPAFTYMLVEADEVDARLYYVTEGTYVEYDPTDDPVLITNSDMEVKVDADHAFLLPSVVWVDTPPALASNDPEILRLDALLVNDQAFDSRETVQLMASSVDLYNFTYVTSNVIRLKHNTTTGTWATDALADVFFRLIPFATAQTLDSTFENLQTAFVVEDQDTNMLFQMKANVQLVTTTPNVFLLRLEGELDDRKTEAELDALKGEENSESTNATDTNLFTSSEASDAVYNFGATDIEDSVVESEEFELGLTMFSRAGTAYNSFLNEDPAGDFTGKQLFAIVPLVTESQLYNSDNPNRNTFREGGEKWEVTAVALCTVQDVPLTFTDGYDSTIPNGTYKVLVVENSNLGDSAIPEPSGLIRFKVKARSTDAESNMQNQTIGQIMNARFRVIPLKQTPTAATTSNPFHLFSRVPLAYRITKTGETVLTATVDDVERRIHQYQSTSATLQTLTVQLVAVPKRGGVNDPDLTLKISTRSGFAGGTTNQFELNETVGYELNLSDLSSADSHVYNITSNSSLDLSGFTESRDFQFTTVWYDASINPESLRLFQVELMGVRKLNAANTGATFTSTSSSDVFKGDGETPTSSELGYGSVYLNWYGGAEDPPTSGDLGAALSGGDNPNTLTESLELDMQIRSMSRTGYALLTGDEIEFSRTIRLRETQTVQEGDEFVFVSPSRTLLSGEGELTRHLASKSERVWIGVLVRAHENGADLRIHFSGQYASTGEGSVTSAAPKFYTSYSEETLVNAANPSTYTYDNGDDRPSWLGAWVDFSDLEITGSPSAITCLISATIRSGGVEQETRLPVDGLPVELGTIDLTQAGRLELVEMSGTELSSLRIGNWTLYTDSAGDLRATHRTFVTGEGSGQDASVQFTLTADSVAALKAADGVGAVEVEGEAFRLTGHANVV